MTPAIVLLSLALTQAGGPTLTLDDAMRAAEKNNTDLQAQRARLAQSREISRKVWAGYLPTISVGGSVVRQNEISMDIASQLMTALSDAGMALPPPDPNKPSNPWVVQPAHQVNLQVQASQALLVPALWPAIRAAYLAGDAAEYGTEAARREVLFGVAQLYYGVIGLKETIAVQEQLLANAKAHETDAKVCVQAGTMPNITLVRAQMDLARAEQDLIRVRNAHASAKIALATLLNRDPNFEVQRPAEPQAPVADAADLTAKALESRPDLRAARASLDMATTNDRWTWLNYLPNVVASGNYHMSDPAGLMGDKGWAVMLGISWTLWDGGLREANWRDNAAKLAEARANYVGAQNKARAEVQQAMLDLESARANKIKSVEQTRLARENMQLVNVSFKAGTATQIQVSDATSALAGAELGLINDSLNADLAALKLMKVAGAFDPR